MNDRIQSKFEERLNQIIGAEQDVNDVLDDLDDEKSQLPVKVEYDTIPSVIDEDGEIPQDMVDDYKHARNTLYGLIERGTVALEGSLIIARESEHPRAFEVSANLMKGIAEITRDLMELQKTMHGGGSKGKQVVGKQVNIQNNYNGGAPSNNDPKDINALLDGLD